MSAYATPGRPEDRAESDAWEAAKKPAQIAVDGFGVQGHPEGAPGAARAALGRSFGPSERRAGAYGGRRQNPNNRATGFTGAISELAACVYLMNLGYYVYRCESPAAPFDLVAYRDGVCLRVEVKTAARPASHNAPSFVAPSNDQWDLLVVVGPDSHVFTFESSMSIEEMRSTVRAHYGFPPSARPELLPCGTNAGYTRHRSRKEAPCDPCRAANAQYSATRHQARKRDKEPS